MKKIVFLFLFLCCSAFATVVSAQEKVEYTVQKIWDNGTYEAFTDLIKYKGKFYCSFREGESHIFGKNGEAEGKIRILCSTDGNKWNSVALIGKSKLDFRDPKLSITPDGKLMVLIGVSTYVNKILIKQITYSCFSTDGINYTTPQPCHVEGNDNHKNDWLWRITWHEGKGYVIDYFVTNDAKMGLWLMSSTDGINFKKITDLILPDDPNESTVRFLPDGEMAAMVRRDKGGSKGYWGLSKAPYTQWNWTEMKLRVGGPNFIVLNENEVIAASRNYSIPQCESTTLYRGNPQTGTFEQLLMLPSGGDTSYAGMLIEGNKLWVSYYSGHDSKLPKIYLAKIPLSTLKIFHSRKIESSAYDASKNK